MMPTRFNCPGAVWRRRAVAIPNRYMHSAVETISLRDIDYAATLLAEFAAGVTDVDSFTPTAALL